MPNERAAADIDPCVAMASSNAILVGPNLRPFASTMQMERRELGIVFLSYAERRMTIPTILHNVSVVGARYSATRN
jgi:hypothetical protein